MSFIKKLFGTREPAPVPGSDWSRDRLLTLKAKAEDQLELAAAMARLGDCFAWDYYPCHHAQALRKFIRRLDALLEQAK